MFVLNYNTNLSDQLGNVMGPNLLGEYLQVVQQGYDPNTGVTTLGLQIFRGTNE